MHDNVLFKRLQTFDFLRGLDDATLARLADNAKWKVFEVNAVVFWERGRGIESVLSAIRFAQGVEGCARAAADLQIMTAMPMLTPYGRQ